MWKKLRKHSVIFSDGTYRDVSMTPEMAKKLVELSDNPILVVAKD